MDYETIDIQKGLNKAGFGPVATDGKLGPFTIAAVKRFQAANGLMPDGKVGPKTAAKLIPHVALDVPDRDIDPQRSPASPKAAKAWPRQSEVTSFYGAPCSASATAGTVKLVAPMRIAWDKGSRVSTFKCHRLVAEPMTEVFARTVEKYGEARWRELGLDLFGGCFNCRAMRGGTRYSMHAFGIAVDIDPERNQLKWGKDRAQLARPEYDDWWKIVESTGAISLGRMHNFDWMHFQYARF